MLFPYKKEFGLEEGERGEGEEEEEKEEEEEEEEELPQPQQYNNWRRENHSSAWV